MSIGSPKIRAAFCLLPVFCASVALTIGLQWRGQAYQSEWTGSEDEPAHYVTGLMVRDYIRAGFPAMPLPYARSYYEHYPKVAIGHWPPVFYILQPAWTLLFGPSRTSLLLLMAVLGGLLLTCTYALLRSYFPAWMAAASVVLIATSPNFQLNSRMVMLEVPTALFSLAALWALGRYLERPGLRTTAWFSFAALAAIFTKGTGIALAPLPLLVVALTRRWKILRSGYFWLPLILAGAPAMLWFTLAPDGLHQSVGLFAGLKSRWVRIPETLLYWVFCVGIAGASLAALGFLRRARAAVAGTERSLFWVSLLVFLPVTIVLRVILGPWEIEYLLATIPPLMFFMCDGLTWIQSAMPRFRVAAAALAVAAFCATAIHNVLIMPPKIHLGIDRVASDLATAPDYRNSRFLIVSDPLGEGVFISEVAVREPRPGHTIERGSKLLAAESFMGDRYRARFTTVAEMMHFFDQGPDRILILDGVRPSKEHQAKVRSMVAEFPDRWKLLGRYPRTGAPYPIEVYRLSGTPEQHPSESK